MPVHLRNARVKFGSSRVAELHRDLADRERAVVDEQQRALLAQVVADVGERRVLLGEPALQRPARQAQRARDRGSVVAGSASSAARIRAGELAVARRGQLALALLDREPGRDRVRADELLIEQRRREHEAMRRPIERDLIDRHRSRTTASGTRTRRTPCGTLPVSSVPSWRMPTSSASIDELAQAGEAFLAEVDALRDHERRGVAFDDERERDRRRPDRGEPDRELERLAHGRSRSSPRTRGSRATTRRIRMPR